MADIITLNDTFDAATIDPVWGTPTSGYQSTVIAQSGGALRYTDGSLYCIITDTYDWAPLHGTQWEIDVAEFAQIKLVFSLYPVRSMTVTLYKTFVEATASVYDGTGEERGDNTQVVEGEFRYLRLFRRRWSWAEHLADNDSLILEGSTNGTDWTFLNASFDFRDTPPYSDTPSTWSGYGVSMEFGGFSNIFDVHGITVPDLEPEDPDPPGDVDDPIDRDAVASAKPEPECMSVIELIREFSASVKRAVRVIDENSISIVDPNDPLPVGYVTGDGAGMYHNANQQLTAGTKVLSMLAGRLSLELSADMVRNDARLLISGWLIPDRLPSPTTAPVAVKRVTYTFTPTDLSTSLEFHTGTAPLNLRR